MANHLRLLLPPEPMRFEDLPWYIQAAIVADQQLRSADPSMLEDEARQTLALPPLTVEDAIRAHESVESQMWPPVRPKLTVVKD